MISSCLSGTTDAFKSLFPRVMNAGVVSRPGAESAIAASTPKAAVVGGAAAAGVDDNMVNAAWLREESDPWSTLVGRLTGCLAEGTASRDGEVSESSELPLTSSFRRVR